MSYITSTDKVDKRIAKYWSTEEINIDLANQLINDCAGLLLDVKEQRRIVKEQSKQAQFYMIFQNIVEQELDKDEFYRLLEIWSKKCSEVEKSDDA